jgi:sugar phosphate isomerase/epimerase
VDPLWHDGIDVLRGEGIEVVSGMLAMSGEDYSTLESIAATGGVRSDAHWGANLDRALQVAAIAQQHDIALVTFHGGFLPHDAADPRRRTMLERIGLVADALARHGVACALETGQESAPTLIAALEALAPHGVGVNFDPANMVLYGMGDPLESAKALAPWIRQVHIKDAQPTERAGTWGRDVPVGEGVVPWTDFLRVVAPLRWRGQPVHLAIERESGRCRDADIAQALSLLERERSTLDV